MRLFSRSLLSLTASAALAACLDLTPTVIPKSDAGSSATTDECLACVNAPDVPGPGCADEVAACNAAAKCERGFKCTLQEGCYERLSDDKALCGRHCATEVGQILSATDPAVGVTLAVYQCIIKHCDHVCKPRGPDGGVIEEEDGGAGEDASVDAAPSTDAQGTACANDADRAVTASFGTAPQDCAFMCLGDVDMTCSARCMETKGFSSGCAKCWGDTLNCGTTICLAPCLDSESPECRACSAKNCEPAFHACSGT